ncbi:zinc finger protein 335-like [Amphiprion ocellaris]|uniref:C2H2-type domain-containing protein n=1 Tax=Amphiprion ocellaris TaxID=80972 RepID=A0AAQ5YMA9_AMPOC|nr:zinc finger protein 335-like [Amphiprion ocellaris]XP_054870849.1 zinc finger protein 335-like [Amphiprion ocellaris]XP_054870850.1 zinc finger protein 335-like [Amphiprion ocellaris]XP_054870851.1 zinc finger protein 335-like [Amphiprion ocellaris]
MSWVKQRYRDISPVTLQVVGGAVSSSLYCGEVEGLLGATAGLVESFLVELYRCKLCQFTCFLKASISSHLLLRHRPPGLTCLGGGAEGGEEAGLQRGASPYQLDLNGEAKQSDEDEDFLLYNMLDNMSPPTCDISTEGGLQVAHTCEVSTLFEEEDSSMFPLKRSSVDLSCPMDPPSTQEQMAQSAHLMTLGLCRISKPPPPPSTTSPVQNPPPPQAPAPPPDRLSCLLCPLTLPSRRLLDVHVRSHRPAGGFSCICCRRTADSWEELQPHWSVCRRRRREELGDRRRRKKAVACQRTFRNTASRNAPTHKYSRSSDEWREQLIGRAEGKKKEQLDRPPGDSLQNVSETKKKTRRKRNEGTETSEQPAFTCSLCHRKFSSKLTLRRHLGVHGGDKPFTCPHCTYSSRLKASLLQHLRTHTGEKPYRCAECPYASIDRSSLLRHSRTHSQVKPYRCQHCDYSSIQKKSLDLHARRHHTGEAFPCQQCDYSSPDRQLLLRHIRRHHTPSHHTAL